MEHEYVLQSVTEVPIEEAMKLFNGQKSVSVMTYTFDGESPLDPPKSIPLSFPPLHPLLSLSKIPPIIPPSGYALVLALHVHGPVRDGSKKPLPSHGIFDLLPQTKDALVTHAREGTHDAHTRTQEEPQSTRRRLNRGAPAPMPINYDTRYNPYPKNKSTGLVRVRESNLTTQVISYWNAKPGLMRHKLPNNGLGTRTYVMANTALTKLLDGSMFHDTKFAEQNRKFSIEEIYAAIDQFSLVCTSTEYMPQNKDMLRRTGFPYFIYEGIKKTSWFLLCVSGNLKRSVEVAMRPHVKPWYDALKEAYLSSRTSRYSHLSERDTENLLDAAKILYNFQRKVMPNLTYAEETIRPLTPLVWCGWLFEALDYKATPSRLADPRSCNYFLYSFLIKKGRLPGTQVEAQLPVSTFSIYEQAL